MGTGNDATAGARSALASLLQSIDRKHQHSPNPARQARGQPEQANRQLETIPVARLTGFKRNPRTHSSKQVHQIAKSIRRFGFVVPVLVNADDQIVAGHGRVQAAKLLGLAEVPVLRVSHLSPAEQRAFVIADNRLAELAGWDRDTLAIELQGLIELDFAVDVIGFEVGEIDLILHDHDEKDRNESAEAKVPKAAAGPAITRCGDVWLLGAHRLDCGAECDARGYAAIDAAIRGWQKFTSTAATLAGSGQSFNEIAKQRRKLAPARGGSGSAAVELAGEAA